MPRPKAISAITRDYQEGKRYGSTYFTNEDFSESHTHRQKFEDAVFIECNLTGATFSQCFFDHCIISTSKAMGLQFKDCKFINCTFDHSDLTIATFPASSFLNCSFRSARIARLTLLTATEVNRCDFSGCTLYQSGQRLPETIVALKEQYEFSEEHNGWIVYRDEIGPQTKLRQPKDWTFEPGKILLEVCDMDRWRVCGPGIAFTQLRYCLSGKVWKAVVPRDADICIPYFHQHGRASALHLIELVNTEPVTDEEIPF